MGGGKTEPQPCCGCWCHRKVVPMLKCSMATCGKEKCRPPVILEPQKLPGVNEYWLKITHPDYVEPTKEEKDKARRKTERAERRKTKLKAAAALAGKMGASPNKETAAAGAAPGEDAPKTRSMMPDHKPGEDGPKPRSMMPAGYKPGEDGSKPRSMMPDHRPGEEGRHPKPRSMMPAGYKPGEVGPKPPPATSDGTSPSAPPPPPG